MAPNPVQGSALGDNERADGESGLPSEVDVFTKGPAMEDMTNRDGRVREEISEGVGDVGGEGRGNCCAGEQSSHLTDVAGVLTCGD